MPRSQTIDDERVIPPELALELYGKAGSRHMLWFCQHIAAYEFALGFLSSQDKVLDLGCGTGHGSGVFAAQCASVVGLDYSEHAVRYAAGRYGSEKCVFVCGDAVSTCFKEESFQAVCSIQVIEHMEDQDSFMSEVLRLLVPGGFFIVATPNKATYFPDTEVGFDFHYKEYHASEFTEFLSRFFPSVELYGLYPKSLLAKLFHDKDMSLFFRKSIIGILPRFIRKEIRRIKWRRNKNSKVSTADYMIKKEGRIDESLDLIAICRKGSS